MPFAKRSGGIFKIAVGRHPAAIGIDRKSCSLVGRFQMPFRSNVRLGSKAVFAALKGDFRSTPESRLKSDVAAVSNVPEAD